jgi:hypothetical protein
MIIKQHAYHICQKIQLKKIGIFHPTMADYDRTIGDTPLD